MIAEGCCLPKNLGDWFPHKPCKAVSWAIIQESQIIKRLTKSSLLRHIEKAIHESRYILDFEDDWDGEGSKSYEEEVWMRAVKFLKEYATNLNNKHGIIIDAPDIGPGPDGSIDLHWRTEKYELLINIPSDPHAMAGFYGDNFGKAKIKGAIDPSQYNMGLIEWLKSS